MRKKLKWDFYTELKNSQTKNSLKQYNACPMPLRKLFHYPHLSQNQTICKPSKDKLKVKAHAVAQ